MNRSPSLRPALLRRAALGLSVLALQLGGCGSSPPVQLYQLRAEPPEALGAARTATGPRWALAQVALPDYLDRDAMVRPTGRAGLSLSSAQRWAEPLRDAVPRLLAADLARLRGGERVWRAPAPAGAGIERTLRVELQRFEADESGASVVLVARSVLLDTAQRVLWVDEARIEAPLRSPAADDLAAAHRLALWRLAQRLAEAGAER